MSTSGQRPPIEYLKRIAAQYRALGYDEYNWARPDTPPSMATLPKPLAECRVGLIATGGIYVRGQTAFTHKDDTSYRAIPSSVDEADLRATHFAYDLTDARRDIGVVFPLAALKELAADGTIGELAPSLFTCMGGIYSQRRVREELVPALVERCLADGIDVVLLVPV
jgi:D-proline reductase (dithiol) PrdB